MTSPETNPQPVQISLEELFNTPEFQYAIDQRVNEKVFDATHPDFIPEYKTGSTPVDGKFTSDSPKAPRLRVPLTDEDVAFLNRPQPESEDLDAAKRTPSMDMDFLTAPVEAPEPKELIRPFSEIVSDINTERSMTVNDRQRTKADGTKTKRFYKESAVDETKVAELFDELAARISTTEATDDIKLKLLISLQEKGNLSEQDITLVMDKLAENEDIITNAENEIDEVLINDLAPSLDALVANGTKPHLYFRDSKNEDTPEFKALDSKFKLTFRNIENPIIRRKVVIDTNTELQKALVRAEQKFADATANNNNGQPANATPAPATNGEANSGNELTPEQKKEALIQKDAEKILKTIDGYYSGLSADKKPLGENIKETIDFKLNTVYAMFRKEITRGLEKGVSAEEFTTGRSGLAYDRAVLMLINQRENGDNDAVKLAYAEEQKMLRSTLEEFYVPKDSAKTNKVRKGLGKIATGFNNWRAAGKKA
jgi:hypothetical protein